MIVKLIFGHKPVRANEVADYLTRKYINPGTKFESQLKDRLLVHDVEIEITPKPPDKTLFSIANVNSEHHEEKQCREEPLKPEIFLKTLENLLTDENILTEATNFA